MTKTVLSFLLFVTSSAFAQPIRLHLMGGFANYTGDLQEKNFTLKQAKSVFTGGATFNLTDKLAVRADYSFAKIGADDKLSSSAGMRSRNLNFQTIIQELNVMGEYDILSLYNYSITPYVFGGIGVFKFSPSTYNAQGDKIYLLGLSTEGQGFVRGRKVVKKTQLNIPVGGGIKYALSDDIHLGFEIGLRILKTDYLDDVSATYIDANTLLQNRGQTAVDLAFRGDELKDSPSSYPPDGTKRGGANVNDFYYYGQFRLSFRMPWFDNSVRENNKGKSRSLGCPTRL